MKIRLFPRAGFFVVAALLALLLFGGCRAFEPEAVVVNQAPETYIIGSPMEHGGGYYHFHVYWYGSDADGTVERFVWALTDTTVQDEDTVEDEEDENFNPALDASQLEIANWTTKTDSIFDFTINQGTSISYDMTLHMVAIDDRGDYDRTPARLHFFANSLGNPEIQFYRIKEVLEGASVRMDTASIALGFVDTVGYNKSYEVFWSGSTPNIRGYDLAALAQIDTVYPYDDGLFGYKWRILGELGGNCIPSMEDCWHPRLFNEASGDSFSIFGDVTRLLFQNNGTGISPFRKLLPPLPVAVQVNSIDVAGVEVADYLREFAFMVNYDPNTIILNGETDWAHPEDTEVYPYYILLNDPLREHHPFSAGDRIPDRSYVVVKALGRDHELDVRARADYDMGFTAYVTGEIENYTGGRYSFQTMASVLDTFPAWGASAEGWYADTLGFLVAPRTEMTVNMQAVDEHGRRDGSPAQLTFDVGFPPCVQCLEVVPHDAGSAFDETLACYDPEAGAHPCFGATPEYYIKADMATAIPDRSYLERLPELAFLAVDKVTKFSSFVTDTTLMSRSHYLIPTYVFGLDVLYHGKDHDLPDQDERYVSAGQEQWRTMAWRMQIDYDCDPRNEIRDGGGSDDINVVNWGLPATQDLSIDGSGLWKKFVRFYVPVDLLNMGEDSFRFMLWFSNFNDGGLPDPADPRVTELVEISLRQFGLGRVRGIALDQTQCNTSPLRPGYYHTFRQLRPATTEPERATWRDCTYPGTNIDSSLTLSLMAMASNDDEPVENFFRVVLQAGSGTGVDMECTGAGY